MQFELVFQDHTFTKNEYNPGTGVTESVVSDTIDNKELMSGTKYRIRLGDQPDFHYGCVPMAEVTFSFLRNAFAEGSVFEGLCFTLKATVSVPDQFYILGIFTVAKVEKTKSVVKVTAYDNMHLLERDVVPFLATVTFPVSVGTLFNDLCAWCEMEASGITFINEEVLLYSLDMSSGTCRNLLSYIADACMCNFYVNRSGYLAKGSYTSKNISFTEAKYTEFTPAEYTTDKVGRLRIVQTNGIYNQDVENGDTENIYTIHDNPVMNGMLTILGENNTPNYDALAMLDAIKNTSYTPGSFKTLDGVLPTLYVGDIVKVDGLNVLITEITASGSGVSYGSTSGGKKRQIFETNEQIRQTELGAQIDGIKKENTLALAEIRATVEGYETRIETAEGTVTTVSATVNGFSTRVTDLEENASWIEQDITSIRASVSGLGDEISSLEIDLDGIRSEVSTAKSDASTALSQSTTAKNNASTALSQSTSIAQTVNNITLTARQDSSWAQTGTFYTADELSVTYGFVLQDGYYVSTNKGVNSSFSYGKLSFDFAEETTVRFDCISYAEAGYDYGILSKLDTDLSKSNSEDSATLVEKSFKSYNSSSVRSVEMVVPAGFHYVTFKYRKDSSSHSYDDCFKIMAYAAMPSQQASIVLSVGGKEQTASIKLTGGVTFEDLSTPGKTQIDGGNVTTGKISAERIDVTELAAGEVKITYAGVDYPILKTVDGVSADVKHILFGCNTAPGGASDGERLSMYSLNILGNTLNLYESGSLADETPVVDIDIANGGHVRFREGDVAQWGYHNNRIGEVHTKNAYITDLYLTWKSQSASTTSRAEVMGYLYADSEGGLWWHNSYNGNEILIVE